MGEFPAHVADIPVVFYDEIGSTNAEALARAKAGQTPPLLIVAGRQTAGRGRRGRPWVSDPGNLYATLLVVDPAPAAVTPQICFVAALALHDAVLDCCPDLPPEDLTLKWPNDLLLNGAKVSGILVEGIALTPHRVATVIGIGVNCKHHPNDTPFPATDLAQAGFLLEPLSLLERFAERWIAREKEWNQGQGFASIRSAWLLRASGIGAAIEVRLLDRSLIGTFESIDEGGALILCKMDGEHETISAGDIFPIAASVG